MKKITILGSTGSIGTQTLDVIADHPEDYKVEGLSAGKNIKLLLDQIHKFQPKIVSVSDRVSMEQIKPHIPDHIQLYCGAEGLIEVAAGTDAEFVMNAVVGSKGLYPTLAAIKAGKHIGIANKETLVSAGHIVTALAKKHQVTLMPVDSEHSAIFQCLNGEKSHEINKIILTASGGSFRDRTREQLRGVSIKEALSHPNWSMGAKITIDSATMVNKGLEVIEAYWLFDVSYDQIEVLQHPESIIHSMVEFNDHSVMAQLGLPDMRVPIQYALSYPKRAANKQPALDLAKLSTLHFSTMDYDRFPCLRLAFESGTAGGSFPTVYNAANEVAVQRFLQGDIEFLHIESIIDEVLQKHQGISQPSLDEISEVEAWARNSAYQVLE